MPIFGVNSGAVSLEHRKLIILYVYAIGDKKITFPVKFTSLLNDNITQKEHFYVIIFTIPCNSSTETR